MKKILFFTIAIIVLSFFCAVNIVKAEGDSFTQTITLNPGWNIVSTPRILDSHSFSVAENSDNFDIYILNPQDSSGWSTMASLGQTELQPLFGYFVNNKTGVDQTLTLNYKQDVDPSGRLFKREFSKNGWYSIGIANPTYAKTQYVISSDTNNPANILFSIKQKISSVIDLTNGNSNISSVAVSSNWKGVNADDLNNLNDLRETKGYAVFINNTDNALYEGFQNNDSIPVGGASVLTVSLSANTPLENNVIVDGTNGVTDVPMLKFDAQSTVDSSIITSVGVYTSFSSGTPTTVKLYDGSILVGSAVASDSLTTFNNLDISVPKDTTKILTVKMDFPAGYGLGEVANSAIGQTIVYQRADGISASATIAATLWGNPMHLYRRAPVISLVSVSNAALASTATASSTLNTIITLKLIPKGGTLTAPVIGDLGSFFASSGASYTQSVASTTVSFSLSPASADYADGNYPENTEVLLTINGNLLGVDRAAVGNVYTRNVLDFLKWTMVGQALVHQTWGLQNFVTPYLLVKVLGL